MAHTTTHADVGCGVVQLGLYPSVRLVFPFPQPLGSGAAPLLPQWHWKLNRLNQLLQMAYTVADVDRLTK